MPIYIVVDQTCYVIIRLCTLLCWQSALCMSNCSTLRFTVLKAQLIVTMTMNSLFQLK